MQTVSPLLFRQPHLPYGHQFPSFVANSLQTTLGTTSEAVKHLSASKDVIYGDLEEHGSFEEMEKEKEEGDAPDLVRLKERLGLEELEDEDMIRLIESMHGKA